MRKGDIEMFMERHGPRVDFVKNTLAAAGVDYVDMGVVRYYGRMVGKDNYRTERLNGFSKVRREIERTIFNPSNLSRLGWMKYAIYVPDFRYTLWITSVVEVKYPHQCCSAQYAMGQCGYCYVSMEGWCEDELMEYVRRWDRDRPSSGSFFEVGPDHPKVVK